MFCSHSHQQRGRQWVSCQCQLGFKDINRLRYIYVVRCVLTATNSAAVSIVVHKSVAVRILSSCTPVSIPPPHRVLRSVDYPGYDDSSYRGLAGKPGPARKELEELLEERVATEQGAPSAPTYCSY